MTRVIPEALLRDAMQEVVNVCAGRAAAELSRLLDDRRVGISIPFVEHHSAADFDGWARNHLAARALFCRLAFTGDVPGRVLVVFADDQVPDLASLLAAGAGAGAAARPEDRVEELACLMATAMTDALAGMLDCTARAETADMEARAGENVDAAPFALEGAEGAEVMSYQLRFDLAGVPLRGHMILLFTDPGALVGRVRDYVDGRI